MTIAPYVALLSYIFMQATRHTGKGSPPQAPYLLNLAEETVNVVPRVSRIQGLLMFLYFFQNEVINIIDSLGDFFMLSRDILHKCWP